MVKGVITRRQKDVSRLLRERKQIHSEKLKAGWQKNKMPFAKVPYEKQSF